MDKLIKLTTTVLFLAIVSFLVSKPLNAATRCEPQYGGGEICVYTGELQINKTVWNKNSNFFVDNLGLNDYKFSPGEEITFKLAVTNVGDKKFDVVHVKDTLPDYLEHISGDLEFDIYDLEVNETEEREIKARVTGSDNFPDNQSIICVVNSGEVWADDENDSDTSQVCIEKKVLGVTNLPPTGPANWQIVLSLSLISSIIGLYLLKFKSKGNEVR